VRTGLRLGDQVQILEGLTNGERIVVSGSFMLDSESRMKLAAFGVHGVPAVDPVCGMAVDEQKARAANRQTDYQGTTYYFCAEGCKKRFEEDPGRFLTRGRPAQSHAPPAASMAPSHGMGKSATAPPVASKDPVCGMDVDETEARAENLHTRYQGKDYFFCAAGCKRRFEKEPERFLQGAGARSAKTPAAPTNSSPPPHAGMTH
jgi:YHS domain-containing protein